MKWKRREKIWDLCFFFCVNYVKLVELRKKIFKEIEVLVVLLKVKLEFWMVNILILEYFKGVSKYDERISD